MITAMGRRGRETTRTRGRRLSIN